MVFFGDKILGVSCGQSFLVRIDKGLRRGFISEEKAESNIGKFHCTLFFSGEAELKLIRSLYTCTFEDNNIIMNFFFTIGKNLSPKVRFY